MMHAMGSQFFGKRTVEDAGKTECVGYGLQFYVEWRVGFIGM